MLQANTILLTCGSKIRSKSLYLLRFQRYLRFFIFRKNSRWPPKVVKLKFSQFQRYLRFFFFPPKLRWLPKVENIEIFFVLQLNTYLLYPVVSKFARNRSISYGFRDICDFSFSAKIQDDRQKLLKLKNFSCFNRILFYYPAGPKFARNRTISYSFRDICHFPQKFKMAAKVVKFEIFHIATEYSFTTLRVKNSLKIALSLTVFEIFALFVFCKK